MEQQGETTINASPPEVWDALHDVNILRQCLQGCESMEIAPNGDYHARISANVGPVKAKFTAVVISENENPPHSYTLRIEVKGGVAGFAKGKADISLVEMDKATVLTYHVNGNVGGRLAQVGSRLIVAASRKIAQRFFSQLADYLSCR